MLAGEQRGGGIFAVEPVKCVKYRLRPVWGELEKEVGSAYAEFAEKEKGTLEPGKLADLVVFAADLFRVPPRQILTTPVDLTVVGGRVVYERER